MKLSRRNLIAALAATPLAKLLPAAPAEAASVAEADDRELSVWDLRDLIEEKYNQTTYAITQSYNPIIETVTTGPMRSPFRLPVASIQLMRPGDVVRIEGRTEIIKSVGIFDDEPVLILRGMEIRPYPAGSRVRVISRAPAYHPYPFLKWIEGE